VYAAFIPDSEGSPTPSVDEIRGAAAVGEGRRERPDFLTHAFVPSSPGGTIPGVKSNVTIVASPLNFVYADTGPGVPPTTAVHELSDAQAVCASPNEKYNPADSRHAFWA